MFPGIVAELCRTVGGGITSVAQGFEAYNPASTRQQAPVNPTPAHPVIDCRTTDGRGCSGASGIQET
jgi:hypothetical protein